MDQNVQNAMIIKSLGDRKEKAGPSPADLVEGARALPAPSYIDFLEKQQAKRK